MTGQRYTGEQQGQWKALAQVHGCKRALEVFGPEMDVQPSLVTLQRWVADSEIEANALVVKQMHDQTRGRVTGIVTRLIEPLEQKIEEAIAGDGNTPGQKSSDIVNYVKSFTFLANLVMPANATGYGGVNVMNNFSVPTVQMPFKLREVESEQEVIEAPKVREVE